MTRSENETLSVYCVIRLQQKITNCHEKLLSLRTKQYSFKSIICRVLSENHQYTYAPTGLKYDTRCNMYFNCFKDQVVSSFTPYKSKPVL